MALYLGDSSGVKINLDNTMCSMNIFFMPPTLENIMLLSSDGYMLSDADGIRLIPKYNNLVINNAILSDY